MSTHKSMNRICVVAVLLSLLAALLFMNGEALGIQPAGKVIGYENRLFDTSRVHTIDIVMDDWDGFIESCQSEEYSVCSAVIDGESYKNIGIRGKGNTSLSSVASMGSSRYSFKIEFDQYDSTKSYHGLDKLSLNNIIQDNTYMKDYLTYRMMDSFGVDSPLCSFAYITVNGEDWGLYLAVEGVEESFLQRNYGSNYGELYKPDSLSFGGGRGNGRDFNPNDWVVPSDEGDADAFGRTDPSNQPGGGEMPDFGSFTPPAAPGNSGTENAGGGVPANSGAQQPPSVPDGDLDGGGFGGGGLGFGSASDVKLQYIDDDPDSYANIFNNAKTEISDTDRARLIASLKSLSDFESLDEVLDVDEVLRYFVVHNFVVNGDSYTGNMIHNYYLYEQDGRLSMIPWDYNLAYGTFQGQDATGSVNEPIDDVLSDRPMQAWIFSDEHYTQRYHELYAEFLGTVDAVQIIEDAYALIAAYVEKDPTRFCTYEAFETGVQTLKAFCTLRQESVEGQLAGAIPSTGEAQEADPSTLVNAEDLNLSDMGTMGGGGDPGGGFGGFGSPGEIGESGNPVGQDLLGGDASPLDPGTTPGGADDAPSDRQPDNSESAPDQRTGNRRPFDSDNGESFSPPGSQTSSGSPQSAAVALAVSVLVLAAGLLFAFKFKR